MHAAFITLAAAGDITYPRFARLESMTEWWQWLLLLLISLVVLAVIVVMYVLDSVELPVGTTIMLSALRIAAFAGLLVYFLRPELVTEELEVQDSRVSVLIDTSQSMGLPADDAAGSGDDRRIDAVARELAEGELIKRLRRDHDVIVYRFDEQAVPVQMAAFSKFEDESAEGEGGVFAVGAPGQSSLTGLLLLAAGAVFAVALLTGFVWLALRLYGKREAASWAMLFSIFFIVGAVVLAAGGHLVWYSANERVAQSRREAEKRAQEEEQQGDDLLAENWDRADWAEALNLSGTETRLSDAVRHVVNEERGGPVAGIIVVSDGNNNAGSETAAVVAVSRDSQIPVYLIGMGGTKRPPNVRVVDLEAPPRVFPGDKFTLNGLVRGTELSGREIEVELLSTPVSDEEQETSHGFKRVRLENDDKDVAVRFDIEPTETGRRLYKLRIPTLPSGDHDPHDNEKTALVEVVDRQTKVLIVAGGPTREYRFLRNQLFRDEQVISHVLLQSGAPGMFQETDREEGPLMEFPSTEDELYSYDCVVAFDADWESFSLEQLKLLEKYVAEQAGGLVVVAGPIYTPMWSTRRRGDEKAAIVKALYPVSFFHQGSATIRLGRFGGDKAFPLAFTSEGKQADFLWLDDEAATSEQSWDEFEGVYGYYAVNEPKPGATVFARFSDRETAIEGELPIYLSGQFYGAGRVFFQASGEMWRIRAVNNEYFEQYYTKLIRWASQGRLLRDSTRGILLVDKDRAILGDHVEVRAILKDQQHRPLDAKEVAATLVLPGGRREKLVLARLNESAREGMYSAAYTTKVEGDYRVELRVPGGGDDELLRRETRVRVPDKEIERPLRNDAAMIPIADALVDGSLPADVPRGAYYVGLAAALKGTGDGGSRPPREAVDKEIQPQPKKVYTPGVVDHRFTQIAMTWLLGIICGVLCMEWITRRLSKLA